MRAMDMFIIPGQVVEAMVEFVTSERAAEAENLITGGSEKNKIKAKNEPFGARKKWQSKYGLSIVELLSAIIVMLLVTATLVIGVRLGVKAYVESVSMSEAQILCSTLTTTISDELRYADTIKAADDGKITFFSKNFGGTGSEGVSFSLNENGQILLGNRAILSKRAYPYGLRAAMDLKYDQQSRIFSINLKIMRDSRAAVLAEDTFEVKAINA